jgi:hypothetical protein
MPRQAGSDAPAHPQGLELNMTERYVMIQAPRVIAKKLRTSPVATIDRSES